MCDATPTLRAEALAEDLLSRLVGHARAVHDGGHVTALHIAGLHWNVLQFLDEVGGFDSLVHTYGADVGW
jgi:hypothetical protein